MKAKCHVIFYVKFHGMEICYKLVWHLGEICTFATPVKWMWHTMTFFKQQPQCSLGEISQNKNRNKCIRHMIHDCEQLWSKRTNGQNTINQIQNIFKSDNLFPHRLLQTFSFLAIMWLTRLSRTITHHLWHMLTAQEYPLVIAVFGTPAELY